jgi:hypothetical protein
MKVSGFSFLRNGQSLGYPFVQSIRSILPIVTEFVVALGPCVDETEPMLREINDPKVRIVHTRWNEHLRSDYSVKGFVYGHQKSVALFNCIGDWAFYLEADEVVHEKDLSAIHTTMERYLRDERVEAMAFDYVHFYGNKNTYAWSPRWYRSEVRIIRNTIPTWSSEALFFNVLTTHRRARYPRAVHTGATIYHYGYLKTREQFELKKKLNCRHFGSTAGEVNYAEIDPQVLRPFSGTHPRAIQNWLPPAEGIFQANPDHRLTGRERKHRVMLKLEAWFGFRFNKKHYRLVRAESRSIQASGQRAPAPV